MSEDNQKVINVFKYGGSSVALGAAVTAILVHYVPDLNQIAGSVQSVITFVINFMLVKSGLLSD